MFLHRSASDGGIRGVCSDHGCSPGDIAKYIVCRVADDVLVDLMGSACGIEYAEATKAMGFTRSNVG